MPSSRLAFLEVQEEPRRLADQKYFRDDIEETHAGFADELHDLREIALILEDVDLVDHQHDLLAQVSNALEKEALGFSEGAVGRRDEQHEIGPRHEVHRQPFVGAVDRVRSGGIHDVEIPQQRDRSANDMNP